MGNIEKRAIWVTIVILIFCSAYYWAIVDKQRADSQVELAESDSELKGDVNEWSESYTRLEDKWKGTSKHVKTLQDSTRLHYKAYDAKVDSIDLTFDKVILQIEQLEERLAIKIDNINESIESLNEKVDGMKRTNKNKFIKLEKDINNLRKDFDVLNAKWIEEFGEEE